MDPVVAAILRTVYGSCGAIELAAEDALVDFLTERGGQVHTEELRPLYNQLPWLKLAVGQLSVFCNASLLLDYAPAECDTPVVRLIAAAASKTQCCVGAESACGGDAAEKYADAAPPLLSPGGSAEAGGALPGEASPRLCGCPTESSRAGYAYIGEAIPTPPTSTRAAMFVTATAKTVLYGPTGQELKMALPVWPGDVFLVSATAVDGRLALGMVQEASGGWIKKSTVCENRIHMNGC